MYEITLTHQTVPTTSRRNVTAPRTYKEVEIASHHKQAKDKIITPITLGRKDTITYHS